MQAQAFMERSAGVTLPTSTLSPSFSSVLSWLVLRVEPAKTGLSLLAVFPFTYLFAHFGLSHKKNAGWKC